MIKCSPELFTSSGWPHKVRGVVDDQLEVVQQQNVDPRRGSYPHAICTRG